MAIFKRQRSDSAAILLTAILGVLGCIVGAYAAQEHQPFAQFDAKVEIDIEDGEVDMTAQFTLASGSNGIHMAKEPLQLRVSGGGRTYSLTIPAGAFKADKSGRLVYLGTIDRVKIVAELRPLRPNTYELELETEGANLNGFVNPITVNLSIGDDGGSRTVRAKFE